MDIISQPVINSIQTWLTHHPLMSWIFNHPFWAIALFLLTLLLSWGLLGALARSVQQLFFWLLQAPLQLLRWLFSLVFKGWRPKESPALAEPDRQRLTVALDRLEALRQEQDQLMQEVRAMLTKN
jgi:hypothetical protein